MQNDENTFTVTDQQEREIIWSALEDYRQSYPESIDIINDLIERVSQTFSWVRNESDPAERDINYYRQS